MLRLLIRDDILFLIFSECINFTFFYFKELIIVYFYLVLNIRLLLSIFMGDYLTEFSHYLRGRYSYHPHFMEEQWGFDELNDLAKGT